MDDQTIQILQSIDAHSQQLHNYMALITIMAQLTFGFLLGYKLGER